MSRIYVDVTTLIAFGSVGHLVLLTAFDGQLVVLSEVRDEVTTQPARTNLDAFVSRVDVDVDSPADRAARYRSRRTLGDVEATSDVELLAAVLAHRSADDAVALVTDDRRLRTIARGLGADVTGTIGVVIRNVGAGLDVDEAKALVRRLDRHGLHMTGELRDRAFDLIDDVGP